jgi:hypothetical protein
MTMATMDEQRAWKIRPGSGALGELTATMTATAAGNGTHR